MMKNVHRIPRASAVWLIGAVSIFGTACSSLPLPVLSPAAPAPAVSAADNGDEDYTQMISVMNADLIRAREHAPSVASAVAPVSSSSAGAVPSRETGFGSLRLNRNVTFLPMPLKGIASRSLEDNFGAPRDGGTRKHRGIDIFAPRGTEIVAVSDGYISYLGEQPKGGRCLWVANEEGMSFYYAHLDSWAPGLYEGMEVSRGTLLGFVGTTGNAVHTPPHLHFAVLKDDEAVNPYPLLSGLRTADSRTQEPVLAGGFSAGSK